MKNQRSQMGDYGFGVSGADQALSPVDLGQLNNNHSLFSPEPLTTPIKMQEENLLEKSQVKANLKASFNEAGSGEPKLEDATKVLDLNNEAQTSSNGVSSHGDQREDTLNDDAVNSVITSLSQLGLTSDVNITGPNIVSSAAPGLWSTAGGDDSLIPAMQSMNGFQPPVHSNPAVNGSFGNLANHQLPLSTLAGVQPPPLRRAITSQNRNAIQQVQQNIFLNNPKTYQSWSNGSPQVDWSQRNQLQNPWTGLPNQRKSMGSLNNLAVANQFKNANIKPAMVMSPSKFRRSTSHPAQFPQNNFGHKAGIEINGLDHGNQFDHLLALQQERNGSMDPMKLATLDTHLLDLIRPTDRMHSSDHLKVMAGQGNLVFAPQLDPRLLPKGKLPFGLAEMDGHALDESSIDQTVPNLSSPGQGSPGSQNTLIDRYSRKVFVGGLPPDIDEEEITAAFRRFGPLVVDWPHKAESKSYFPPKGYCFLIFQDEMSVHHLTASCIVDDSKLYWCVSSPTMKDKPVQIRPWSLGDSDFVMDGTRPLDPRKTIFVGGVPRPLRAVELAMIMDRLYGGVCYAGIDTDPELKYPKGAGRVAFSSQQSYIAAISARFVQLQHADIDKRVEVKPYVLDDQMCDECQGARCGGKFAPFFCASITCLQYYCESCWGTIHSRQGREFHKPLVKEGADRPRTVPFRWC